MGKLLCNSAVTNQLRQMYNDNFQDGPQATDQVHHTTLQDRTDNKSSQDVRELMSRDHGTSWLKGRITHDFQIAYIPPTGF